MSSMKTKINCIFCRCIISVKDGDKARFEDHMNNEHDVRFDFDILLVVTIMTQGERLKLTRDFSKKVSERLRSNPKPTKIITDDISTPPTTIDNDDEKIVISDSDENEENDMDETLDENSEAHEDSITNEDDEKEDENDNMEVARNERQEDVPKIAPPRKVEGVLKCKFCSKYIKQSLMDNHKLSLHKEELEKVSDANRVEDEKLLREHKVPKTSKIHNFNEDRAKRKYSRAIRNSDDDEDDNDSDTDWNISMEKQKRSSRAYLPCKFCRKRFGSSFTLTQHERTAH